MSQVTIHDANGNIVTVEEGRLRILADVQPEFKHVSESDSLSFAWSIVAADFAAAATLLIVQNTSSDLVLHIAQISFSTDNASEVDIHTIAGATTPSGGTAVVGRCLNVAAKKVAEAVGHSNDTANSAQGDIIWSNRVLAATLVTVDFHGALILGNTDAIAVDITTAPTSLANCNIMGFYDH
jgi:hypothetical protein